MTKRTTPCPRAHRRKWWALGLWRAGVGVGLWLPVFGALVVGMLFLGGCSGQSPEVALEAQLQALREPSEAQLDAAFDPSELAALKEAGVSAQELYRALFSHVSYGKISASEPVSTNVTEPLAQGEPVFGDEVTLRFDVVAPDIAAATQRLKDELNQQAIEEAQHQDAQDLAEHTGGEGVQEVVQDVVQYRVGSGGEANDAAAQEEAKDQDLWDPAALKTLAAVLGDASLPTVTGRATVRLRNVEGQWLLESPEEFLRAVFAGQDIGPLIQGAARS